MSLCAQDIQNNIEKVMQQITDTQQEKPQKSSGILAVFSDNVFDPQGVKAFIKDKNVICALPDKILPIEGCQTLRLDADKNEILAALTNYEQIVLVTPPLSLLKCIACADDSTFAASLILRPLLWGKEVSVLLDFETPRHMRGTALAAIAQNIDTLEKMGIGIKTLKRNTKAKQAKELVTEQDVRDACRDGSMKVTIAPGAIVTQLAQDTAKECGVSIEY